MGLVTQLEEANACDAANYRYFVDWPLLSVEEKAFHIAHYRVKGAIESNKEDAVAAKIKRDSKKKKKGG